MIVTVDDLKQYLYCKRIPLYSHLFGKDIPKPFLVTAGKNFENELDIEYIKQIIRAEKIDNFKLIPGTTIVDKQYELIGKPDFIVSNKENCIPLEIKYSENPSSNVLYQLIAYALLIENKFKMRVKKAYVFYGKRTELNFKRFDISLRDKETTIKILKDLQTELLNTVRPEATENVNKCYYCEYKNFCDDVL